MKPPRAGPTRAERPKTAPKRPWYLPRSAGVKRSPITARAIGKSEPGADPLDAAEEDQLPHLLGEAGQGRADQEDGDPDDQQRPPPVEVGELAVEGDGDGARQEVDRDRPGVEVVALEVRDDVGKGHSHDRLVERSEEQRKHDGAEDLEAGTPRDLHRRVQHRAAFADETAPFGRGRCPFTHRALLPLSSLRFAS